MFKNSTLGKKMTGIALVILITGLLGGCCSMNRCGNSCGNQCGNPCGKTSSWPNCSLEMGFFPAPSQSQCYNPCYPYAVKRSSAASPAQTQSDNGSYENSGYLSDAEAGGSGTSNY